MRKEIIQPKSLKSSVGGFYFDRILNYFVPAFAVADQGCLQTHTGERVEKREFLRFSVVVVIFQIQQDGLAFLVFVDLRDVVIAFVNQKREINRAGLVGLVARRDFERVDDFFCF